MQIQPCAEPADYLINKTKNILSFVFHQTPFNFFPVKICFYFFKTPHNQYTINGIQLQLTVSIVRKSKITNLLLLININKYLFICMFKSLQSTIKGSPWAVILPFCFNTFLTTTEIFFAISASLFVKVVVLA